MRASQVLDAVLRLHARVGDAGSGGRLWIAYSGGLDSHALLHALAAQRTQLKTAELRAVHVNHGLSVHAPRWARHCTDVCADLDVPCLVLTVDAHPAPGESPEARAREARYAALAGLLRHGDCLLTAQHQDDQAETVLLQLLRGAGPHGLVGMPAIAALGSGWLLRPLLVFSRSAIRHYAEQHGLLWVDDESNYDTRYDRNYLRHAVLPRLGLRWPGFAETVARAAQHQVESVQLLDMLAREDYARARPKPDGSLSVPALRALHPARQRNVIRHWLRTRALPLPNARHLQRILTDVLAATRDRQPCVRWQGAEVRRYRDRVHAMQPLRAHDSSLYLAWDMRQPLELPGGNGTLVARPAPGEGLAGSAYRSASVTVRFRRGGERCQPVGRAHHHVLKKLFQEAGVPPWERDRVPLVFVGEHLAAVVGLCVCQPFQAGPGEIGVRVEWCGGSADEKSPRI